MEQTPQNLALFKQAQKAVKRLGINLKGKAVGGGSDGNFTLRWVSPRSTVGCDRIGIHARDEHIIIEDIALRSALIAEIILGSGEVSYHML